MLAFLVVVLLPALVSSHTLLGSVLSHTQSEEFSHTIVAADVPRALDERLGEFALYDSGSLPHKVASRSRKNLNGSPTADDYFRMIPIYQGTAIPNAPQFTFSSPCFHVDAVVAELADSSTVRVTMSLSSKTHLMCTSMFLLSSLGPNHVLTKTFPGKHVVEFTGLSGFVLQDVVQNGIRVFEFQDDVLGTIKDTLDTIALFFQGVAPIGPPDVSTFEADRNRKFLKDHMNYDMPERSRSTIEIDESQIHSGDFLGIIRLDGLDPMVAYGMGSFTGHTAYAIRLNGELYVAESTDKSHYWPNPGIQKTPWKTWLELARKASYNVVILPLSDAKRAQWNQTAAEAFMAKSIGLPYGYHNFLFGWIDTPTDNYPPPLSEEIVKVGFAIVDNLNRNISTRMWNQALNKRLGTVGLTTLEIYETAASRGIKFGDLMSRPEQDSWIYTDGPSMVCDVFVCETYKAAGLFRPLTDDQINCSEFTDVDVYQLNFFNSTNLYSPLCKETDPSNNFCQIEGKYRMSLPLWNTVAPYPHMRENCPGLPPLYNRPANC